VSHVPGIASFAVPAVLRILASTSRGCWAVRVDIRATVAMTAAANRALVSDVFKRWSLQRQYDPFYTPRELACVAISRWIPMFVGALLEQGEFMEYS
jgi:hypothetical protein